MLHKRIKILKDLRAKGEEVNKQSNVYSEDKETDRYHDL